MDYQQPMAGTPWSEIGWAKKQRLTEGDFTEQSNTYRDIQAVMQQRQFTVTSLRKRTSDELVYIAGHRDGISQGLYKDDGGVNKAEREAKVKANAIRAQHVLNEKFLERQAKSNRLWTLGAAIAGAVVGAAISAYMVWVTRR